MGYFVCVETWLGKGSALSAVFTLLRSPLGIGLFLLPWTIAINGVTQGFIVVTLVILLNAYRSYVLFNIASIITKGGITSPTGYSDWWLLEGCLGGVKTRTATCILIVFSMLQWLALLGNATVLFAFCGLNMSQISNAIAFDSYLNVRLFTCICVAVVVIVHPFVQLIRVKVQKPLENRNCNTFYNVGIILAIPAVLTVFIFLPMIIAYSMTHTGDKLSFPSGEEYDWGRFPIVIVLSLFVVGAAPDDVTLAFGSLYKNINFLLVILISSGVTMAIALTFGTLTLLGMQTNICTSITLSLPRTAIFDILRAGTIVCAFLTLLFKFQMDPRLSSRLTNGEIACDVIFKMMFLSLAGAVAIGLPSMAGIASLFGSTASVILTILFPFTADLLIRMTGRKVFPDEEKTYLVEKEGSFKRYLKTVGNYSSKVMMGVDILFLIFGLCLIVTGLWSTVKYFVDVFQLKNLESEFCPLNLTADKY